MKKFENFVANLEVLKRAKDEDLTNEFIISGIIDKFFLQFELSWKVLKELLSYEGRSVAKSGSPREILKAAYATYDYIDEDIWLEMLRARNDMTHIYNGEAARQMVKVILEKYIPVFVEMRERIEKDYGKIVSDL
ncbi:HI0074 family nucleotidyltransferase substrate-binding subunit [Lachnoclostridium sp. An118]|nr:HI0074 family nucleotidyltransferase substrate-binding subunit [Lachnoclostridium sp. An118]OUQ51687.1 nucleotidyltransferase [Lachnoclostridium sp. An118]HJA43394.1 HI0074 family nucleotidyltransferase substrate-binding subunit [Candidatus Dorea stercoravium]